MAYPRSHAVWLIPLVLAAGSTPWLAPAPGEPVQRRVSWCMTPEMRMKHKFYVCLDWYPDDDLIDPRHAVEADTPGDAAEEACHLNFSNWDYPSEITVKVLPAGEPDPSKAELYEVYVESVPHFSATPKKRTPSR